MSPPAIDNSAAHEVTAFPTAAPFCEIEIPAPIVNPTYFNNAYYSPGKITIFNPAYIKVKSECSSFGVNISPLSEPTEYESSPPKRSRKGEFQFANENVLTQPLFAGTNYLQQNSEAQKNLVITPPTVSTEDENELTQSLFPGTNCFQHQSEAQENLEIVAPTTNKEDENKSIQSGFAGTSFSQENLEIMPPTMAEEAPDEAVLLQPLLFETKPKSKLLKERKMVSPITDENKLIQSGFAGTNFSQENLEIMPPTMTEEAPDEAVLSQPLLFETKQKSKLLKERKMVSPITDFYTREFVDNISLSTPLNFDHPRDNWADIRDWLNQLSSSFKEAE